MSTTSSHCFVQKLEELIGYIDSSFPSQVAKDKAQDTYTITEYYEIVNKADNDLTINNQLSNPEGLHFYKAETAPYRFKEFNKEAKQYLDKNGFVAIANVLNNSEICNAKSLLWDFIEKSTVVERDNIKTLDDGYWVQLCGDTSSGLITDLGMGQSEFQWYIRTNEKILNIWQKVWNVNSYEELLCSFDGVCIFRPFKYNLQWKTTNKWYHVDQNPIKKPNFACYQSYVSLLDQNEHTGGTTIIPKSHLKFKNVCVLIN